MAQRLSDLGYEVTTGVGRTGVVATLDNGAGHTVLLRADIDALPGEGRHRADVRQHRNRYRR